MAEVSPSVLDADFSKATEWIKVLEKEKADYLHWDIMDGKYVPPETFDAEFVAEFRKKTKLAFDVHLMVEKPEEYLGEFSLASDILTFHPECSEDPESLIDHIHALEVKAGIAINNKVSVKNALPFLDDADLVLVMSVEAGYGGQNFNSAVLEKISFLKEQQESNGYHYKIEVDGGINAENGKQCTLAGADILVAGSFIMKAKDISSAIKQLKHF